MFAYADVSAASRRALESAAGSMHQTFQELVRRSQTPKRLRDLQSQEQTRQL